ncbi:MAG: 8-amino-7-oxononanoate synthase [Porticoccaceae bacterium]|nr:8-amino-7-oxononanoate synthase [Porticoccaceae bacterium]
MSNSMDRLLQENLEKRRLQHLYRSRVRVDSGCSEQLSINDKLVHNFCSNDYLGLADNAVIADAFKKGIDQYGTGSGASHLINGHSKAHCDLEQQLAEFTGRPRALLFSTGYMANIGVIGALVGRSDAVLEDHLNHASLLDGGLLSRAKFQRYKHRDCIDLDKKLGASKGARKLVVTDGVFSMDGDLAPLADLADVAQKNDAWLMVDDAHGFGVLGDTGAGIVEEFNLGMQEVPVLMGTLGKAFGTYGAFVAGSEALIETLIQFSRSYIYTTAPPPAVAVATSASLELVKKDHWRRDKLNQLIARFRAGAEQIGLRLMTSNTPIQPVLMESDTQVLEANKKLLENGFMVGAIRPPTVPEGTGRLRITLSANHSEQQVDALLDALDRC